MSRIVGWLLTPIHLLIVGMVFLGFHVPLIITRRLLGLRAFDCMMNLMAWSLLWNIRLIGSRITVIRKGSVPVQQPLILVANHQSIYDVPLLMWYLRPRTCRFISKVEMSRGLPSASFALRNGEHLLIKRSEREEAVTAIRDFGERINAIGGTVVIFPEGTRARDGKIKTFKLGGFAALVEAMPDAAIIPVMLDGTWALLKHRLLPVPFGVPIDVAILPAVTVNPSCPKASLDAIEATIGNAIAASRAARSTGKRS